MKVADPKTTAGRAFVRSLNILLKFARLYGYEHTRTIEQLDTAWRELRAAIPAGTEARPAARCNRLAAPPGRRAAGRFACRKDSSRNCFPAAGLASVQFFPSITEEEFGRFARAFPTGKSKPAELAEQLKGRIDGRAGRSHQRSLLRGHRFALPRCQRGGATRRRDPGRRSGSIQTVAERSSKAVGDDCGGARARSERRVGTRVPAALEMVVREGNGRRW